MLYTKNQIQKLISNYDILLEYVDSYVRETYPNDRSGEVRIYCGRIEKHVNTSCHCHPEYEWVDRGSIEDFSNWISSEGIQYRTTYYTVKQ